MTSRRLPAAPPDIPGFTHVGLLGSGGYSDVFLYEQQMPRRKVAVKVLTDAAVTGAVRKQFTDEANVMARLSTHPYIVTIFQADVSSDGRPYLVMEYYPRPNFSVRCRSEQIPVAEALRVGVQVASAVETAHRAGILHRDIKPANLLTSDYGRPGLTDFGISGTKADASEEASGLSIPWSPPEVIDGRPSDERADVYSLGATVYTLLTGRSPFEFAGQANTSLELMDRIERNPVPPTGRPDVPTALERVLAQAMSKRPEGRQSSAAAFARDLQSVELEMKLAVTPIDVLDEGVSSAPTRGTDGGGDGDTRVKGVVRVDAQPPAGTTDRSGVLAPRSNDATVARSTPSVAGMISAIPTGPFAVPTAPQLARPREGILDNPGIESTMVRAGALGARATAIDSEPKRSRRGLIVGSVAVLAVAAAIGVIVVALDTGETSNSSGTSTTVGRVAASNNPTVAVPDPPSDLRFVRDSAASTMTVSWSAPSEPVDFYRLEVVGGDGFDVEGTKSSLVLETVSVESSVCVRLVAVNTAGRASGASDGCWKPDAPAPTTTNGAPAPTTTG